MQATLYSFNYLQLGNNVTPAQKRYSAEFDPLSCRGSVSIHIPCGGEIMRYMNIIILFIVLVVLGACGQKVEVSDGIPVGLIRLQLEDPVRLDWNEVNARPLVTYLWYPAVAGSKMQEIGIPPARPVFIGGFAGRGAELAEKRNQYPLIIMSHGTGGAGMQMMWLGRELAAKGYIVAAVDHHGNTAAEDSFDPRGFRMPWERAKDLSSVLDLLLADPNWGPRIDERNIGAVGFSLGGYTVTALAGGRLNFEQFEAFCQSSRKDSTCEEQSEFPEAGKKFEILLKSNPELVSRMSEHRSDFSDARINAVVALAPALSQALTDQSLAAIEIPYITIVGDMDQTAPSATNASRHAAHIPASGFHVLPKNDHYVFLNRCNRRGKRFVPVCKEPSQGSRALAHVETINIVTDFFNKVLDN